jgi:cell division protein FtsB
MGLFTPFQAGGARSELDTLKAENAALKAELAALKAR